MSHLLLFNLPIVRHQLKCAFVSEISSSLSSPLDSQHPSQQELATNTTGALPQTTGHSPTLQTVFILPLMRFCISCLRPLQLVASLVKLKSHNLSNYQASFAPLKLK